MLGKLAPGGVQFRPLTEPWAGTGTSTGRLMLAVLGGLTDVERDLIRTRTAEDRSRPRSEESTWGGPGTAERGDPAASAGATLQELANSYDRSISTIRRAARAT